MIGPPPPFDTRALFRAFPRLAGRVPWLPFGAFPTPLEQIGLADSDPGRIFIKRDDLSGDAYGGNKVRKLEHLLAAAVESGAQRVITAGAFGSHHALATTVYAARFGLRCTCVLFPQRITPHVRNILLALAGAGADLRLTPRMETVPLALRAARRAHLSERPHVIAPGGSDALGTLAFVGGGVELATQLRAAGARQPVEVVVAAGTLGTAAGIALGLAAAGMDARVRGVRITSRLVTNRAALRRLIRGAAGLLREAGYEPPSTRHVAERVALDHTQIGDGYGRATAASERAAAHFAALGIHLDTTYTAKAAAGLLAAPRGAATLLYWHTLSRVEAPPTGLADEAELPEALRVALERARDRDLASGPAPG